MRIFKIGTVLYAVNKALQIHAKVLPARVIGYQNVDGTIHPIVKLVGGKEICPISNKLFDKLEDAVNSIKGKKV